jgi:hypothetical protein
MTINGNVSALESTVTFKRNYCKTINIQINTVNSSLQFEKWLTAWYKPTNNHLIASYECNFKMITNVPIRNITSKNIAKVPVALNWLT